MLFSHLEFPGSGWAPLRPLHGRCGFLGVQIFFVLSGFLITTLMLREIKRTGRLSLRGFYWRRLLRIVPVYLVFLAVLGVLQAAEQVRLDGRAWFALGTYTVNFLPGKLPQSISHVWSLSVEEHFYCLWPLLMALAPAAWRRKAALTCIAAALGLRWFMLLAFPEGSGSIDLWTFTRIDDVAVGCLLAFLAHDAVWRERLDRFTADGRRLGLLAAAFLTSQFLCSNVGGAILFPAVVVKLLVGLANDANSIAVAVFLWALLTRPAGAAARLLNHSAIRFVGVISYSLYLWHPLFLGGGWFGSFPVNLAAIFATATLSYYLIERPFLALKEGTGRPPRRAAALRCAPQSP